MLFRTCTRIVHRYGDIGTYSHKHAHMRFHKHAHISAFLNMLTTMLMQTDTGIRTHTFAVASSNAKYTISRPATPREPVRASAMMHLQASRAVRALRSVILPSNSDKTSGMPSVPEPMHKSDVMYTYHSSYLEAHQSINHSIRNYSPEGKAEGE